jgi:hypothetical protein
MEHRHVALFTVGILQVVYAMSFDIPVLQNPFLISGVVFLGLVYTVTKDYTERQTDRRDDTVS